MKDPVEPCEIDRAAREVDASNVEPARVLLLECDVVVVREAVEPDDIVASSRRWSDRREPMNPLRQ